MDACILVVDDDPAVTAALRVLLENRGWSVATAAGPEQARACLAGAPVDLVLQDMNFSNDTSGAEGLALLEGIRAEHPALPVVLLTAWGSIELAVAGMKRGAADFLTKPWRNDHLLASLATALELRGAGAATRASREELDAAFDLHRIVGRDPALLRLLELVGRVAPTDASVLVTGESGTGKELIAEAIHRNSRRADGPFVKVNLGGISSALFESEMFGHVKGAFTDAAHARRGRFAVAHGGTIFLDEIGDLDPGSQVKLLRVLQDRSFEVLGSSATHRVDVRVVSATNRDLPRMVAAGSFREDLYYRLNLITLELPALRERPGDIGLLAEHVLARCRRNYRRPDLAVSPGALAWLREQRWPGNVRQLQQTIERAVLVGCGDVLEIADLRSDGAAQGGGQSGDTRTLDAAERALIERTLERCDGNLTRTAAELGLSRGTLYRKLEKHGLKA